jgi:hypothetical protein
MSIIRSDELCDSSAARETKSSSRVIAIIIGSLNNILSRAINFGHQCHLTI